MQSLFPRLRQLILPFFALPNDPAIILGPDLPPCMTARYAAAMFYRPPNTSGDGIAGRPYLFRAQVNTATLAPGTNEIEEGWLVYDAGNSVCGFIVTQTFVATNNGTGGIGNAIIFATRNAGGAGVTTTSTQIIFGNGVRDTQVDLGDSVHDPGLTRYRIDGRSVGRGILVAQGSTGSSAATGAVEVLSLTSPTFTIWDGRVIEIKLTGQVLTSVANSSAFMSIRRNNLAGPLLGITGVDAVFTTVADHYEYTLLVANASGAAITDNVVSTIIRGAGGGTVQDFGGGVAQQRVMTIRDVGQWSDYLPASPIQF